MADNLKEQIERAVIKILPFDVDPSNESLDEIVGLVLEQRALEAEMWQPDELSDARPRQLRAMKVRK